MLMVVDYDSILVYLCHGWLYLMTSKIKLIVRYTFLYKMTKEQEYVKLFL